MSVFFCINHRTLENRAVYGVMLSDCFLLYSKAVTQHGAKFLNNWYKIVSFEGLRSLSSCPPNPLFPIETEKVGYCPKTQPVLFTIITQKSDSRFHSTGNFCGRLYRSGVLMSSRGAVANGVVSGVRGKRPRWDYHSQGGLRKVLPAQALRVWATHFRGQGKLSNKQPGLSYP